MKYTVLLDSSNTSLTVALADEKNVIENISYEAWQSQSEYMIPELEKLLDKHSVSKGDIDAVMVTKGPGSYTGVRISITIAKVMAVTLNIPVYELSSLQVLKHDDEKSLCVINARNGRSYAGVYEGAHVLMKDTILTNDEVKKMLVEHPEYELCGECKYLGLDSYHADLSSQMLSLKEERFICPNALALKPVYLKD